MPRHSTSGGRCSLPNRTQNFGFHNAWEFWLYQTWYGLFVCPWYSYSQIMISEVTPRGKEFLFFSLFSIIGKTSAFIGPIISSAIVDASPTGDNSLPFYFLFAVSVVSMGLIVAFVDLGKSRREQEAFLDAERRVREKRASIISVRDVERSNSVEAHHPEADEKLPI